MIRHNMKGTPSRSKVENAPDLEKMLFPIYL